MALVRDFLNAHGVPPDAVRIVPDGVALHTTQLPGFVRANFCEIIRSSTHTN